MERDGGTHTSMSMSTLAPLVLLCALIPKPPLDVDGIFAPRGFSKERGGRTMAIRRPGTIIQRTLPLVPAKCAGKVGTRSETLTPAPPSPLPLPLRTASGVAEAWATRAVEVRTRILQLRSEDHLLGYDARFVVPETHRFLVLHTEMVAVDSGTSRWRGTV